MIKMRGLKIVIVAVVGLFVFAVCGGNDSDADDYDAKHEECLRILKEDGEWGPGCIDLYVEDFKTLDEAGELDR